jgi:hypothetical protein
MNGERIFKIVMMELTSDSLKLEEELERTVNSDIDVNEKTIKIKDLLSQIAITEASIAKFTNMVSTNNNELNNEQNGKF